VDVVFNETFSQYRDPSTDKSKRKRTKKHKVGKKKLFGRNKSKRLKKDQDPFVTKTSKKNSNPYKDSFKSGKRRKKKIKEKDALVSKGKSKNKYQPHTKKIKTKKKGKKANGKKAIGSKLTIKRLNRHRLSDKSIVESDFQSPVQPIYYFWHDNS